MFQSTVNLISFSISKIPCSIKFVMLMKINISMPFSLFKIIPFWSCCISVHTVYNVLIEFSPDLVYGRLQHITKVMRRTLPFVNSRSRSLVSELKLNMGIHIFSYFYTYLQSFIYRYCIASNSNTMHFCQFFPALGFLFSQRKPFC